MDRAQQLSEFLQARRARLTPTDAGVPDFGGQRRVPGLRREELALLAGVSVDYYTRLEQGRARNVSTDVLNAVARALRLDSDERAHLCNLARPTTTRKRPSRPQQVGAEIRQALDALTGVPAYIIGRRLDILAWNDMARALIADFPTMPAAERNMARLVFLDEASQDLYPDWDDKARDTVSNLRLDAGRHPDDPQLVSLIGELSLGSDGFRRLWADHDVRGKTRGKKRFAHPQLGDLTLDYVAMRAPDDPDMTMMIYSAPDGSDAARTLQLLASLSLPAAENAETPNEPRRPSVSKDGSANR
ncbi:helix-turn-helix transcriptional regulator [Streptomyces sp. NPDC006314]|uniref:helix-turn-helix domain-containing protein n=1 Tax=Streptomyces sp. NPDC006314 TaxID=3154475 RepID=UPI0033B92BF7